MKQVVLCEGAPVSGHNFTGLIESFRQNWIEEDAFAATGLRMMAILTENNLNNLSIGFSYGLTIRSRALDGPIKFPIQVPRCRIFRLSLT